MTLSEVQPAEKVLMSAEANKGLQKLGGRIETGLADLAQEMPANNIAKALADKVSAAERGIS